MTVQLRDAPEWYRYFGGLADKIEGAVLPIDKPGMYGGTLPADDAARWRRNAARFRQLDELAKRVRALERKK